MSRPYHPYIPKNVSEIMDLLGSMMLSSPTFKDKTGYFPERSIDTEFLVLKEGLGNIRRKVGEDRYLALIALADRMRTHFEADPEDKTEDGLAGRQLILDMEDLLRQRRAAGKQAPREVPETE